ncbi:MAG: ABC transporter permease [Planctomycetes bacterium]|nr:ABC transporter permease [Planctomycetota bacterium]MBI3844402.1 ABC transporter permease [Planctomycetota bacterium]
MSGIPLAYNVRNLAVRRVSTAMTALGVALPTTVFCSVLALRSGLKAAFVRTGSPETIVFLRKSSMTETNSTISRADAPIIEALGDVAREPESGRPIASSELVVLLNCRRRSGSGSSNVAIRGTTPLGRGLREGVRLLDGRWPGVGLAEVAVARGIAERFEGCSMGSRLPLGKRDWRVVGTFDAGATAYGSEVWADADTLAAEFHRDAWWSAVWVRAKPGELRRVSEWAAAKTLDLPELGMTPESFVSEAGLALLLAPSRDARLKTLEAMTERDYFGRQTETASPISGIGAFIALFMAIGAAFAVMNTMYAAIAGRGREIAVLRAMGFRRRAILTSFLLEAILLAAIGALVGALASFAVNGVSTGTANFASFTEVTFAFRVNASVIARGFGFGLLLGAFGGLFPAIRAARRPIVSAMRAV